MEPGLDGFEYYYCSRNDWGWFRKAVELLAEILYPTSWERVDSEWDRVASMAYFHDTRPFPKVVGWIDRLATSEAAES